MRSSETKVQKIKLSGKAITAIFLACVSTFGISTAANAVEKIIKVDGSSTVYPITEAVAEEFQNAKKVKVTVGISGTGGGFKKFCRGETDVSNASRPILKKEMDDCKAAGVQFIELPVAYDALTVVVSPKNNWVKSLTVEELNKMWAPAAQTNVKSWNQINPNYPDRPLKLFGPGADSGTFDYFTEAIVGKAKSSRGDYTASEDDNVLVSGVSGDAGALGYFGYAYYDENKDKLKAVPISPKAGAPAVLPSAASVQDASYQPLSRPLFIYVNLNSATSKPEVKAFIDYYLANAAQLTKEVKFVALPANEYAAVTAHWKSLKPGTGFDGTPEVGIKIEELLKRIK